MSKLLGTNLRVVLDATTSSLSPEARVNLCAGLLGAGFELSRAPQGWGTVERSGPTLVLGCFGGKLPEEGGVRFVDLDAEDGLAAAQRVREAQGTRDLGNWKPWFPVIDYTRCTNCMQCLTFCLFDVYGVDGAGQIQVQNQDNCKTDCPACSRVCPEVAILFPKYKKGPINGAEIKQEDLEREAMKVDISALLGGDLYGALRDRQKSARKRFSTERDASKALLERKRCLKKLKKQLDIPDEVLMTLPSAEDIEARAERARAKLARRRAASQTVRDTRPPPSADDWGI